MAERGGLIETWLGKDEKALRKLITAAKGSSVIANYIHVDRKRLGIPYKHALMITSKVNESTEGGEDDSVTRLGIAHYNMKSWDKRLKQYLNPFDVPSYGKVEKAELVIKRKFDEDGSFKTEFDVDYDTTKLLQDCVDGKFHLVTHPDFPQTVDDKRAAAARAEEFIGEDAYSFASRNCQHLITDILLGEAISDDAEKNKLVGSTLDSLGQSCYRVVGHSFRFCRVALHRLSPWMLELLKTACNSGVFNSLLSSVGDDAAEWLGQWLNLLAVPELDPTEIFLKDTKFALFLEFTLFTMQTVWQLFTGKESKEMAPMLIKRFMGAFCGSAGAAAGSALALLVFGGGVAPFVCQGLAGLICHAFGMWFGDRFLGGKIEKFTISVLDKLREMIVWTGQTAEHIKQRVCDYFEQLGNWLSKAVAGLQAEMCQFIAE